MNNELIIGSDHAGYKLKEFISDKLRKENYQIKDIGTYTCESIDYPDIAHPLSESVAKGEYKFGILVCGTGNGMAIAANKHKGVRAALCWNLDSSKLARTHSDANIICLPARFINDETAMEMVKIFLATQFEGGRHKIRVKKIG
jgi:ribose 5-phosphate isomerase B